MPNPKFIWGQQGKARVSRKTLRGKKKMRETSPAKY